MANFRSSAEVTSARLRKNFRKVADTSPLFSCLYLLLLNSIYWVTEVNISDREVGRSDLFWRRMVLPQEERGRSWDGIGYRWFRSENVIPLERYLGAAAMNRIRHWLLQDRMRYALYIE